MTGFAVVKRFPLSREWRPDNSRYLIAISYESVTDDADLEEVYNTERHLLYVACTRARDQLMVSGVDPVSEFLDDLTGTR